MAAVLVRQRFQDCSRILDFANHRLTRKEKMSFFKDLSTYCYFDRDHECLNVGWIETDKPFLTGPVPPPFIEKLAWTCVFTREQQTRGLHECSLCPPMKYGFHHVTIEGVKHVLGSAEIRVRGQQGRYAAPNLILHYVVEHGYRPPDDFIAGILCITDSLSRDMWSLTRGPYW